MRIKIAARKSDLARLQAYRVGQALQSQNPQVQIEYFFSTSLGDQNLETPLWQMPEKGVFTEDLTKKIMQGECDLVVHSWKDLPTEPRDQTEIAATLPRADARDLILFRKATIVDAPRNEKVPPSRAPGAEAPPARPFSFRSALKIFSSSPRRILNVGEFLKWALPFEASIEFKNIRGNIPTRVKKLMTGEADGLVLAKAAVDRLLASTEPEFQETRDILRSALAECRWMITPLTANPNAPAQGALAIEILKSREDLRELLQTINCPTTFKNAEREREILQKYGGGCHQKIGVACMTLPFGEVEIERGEKPASEGPVGRLDAVRLMRLRSAQSVLERNMQYSAMPVSASFNENASANIIANIFPAKMSDSRFYNREPRELNLQKLADRNLWVAKAEAWPENYVATENQIVWSAGLTTWQKLAKKGVWVSGSQESFGEDQENLYDIATLLNAAPNFLKLSHNEAEGLGEMDLCVTYDLATYQELPSLDGKTHFYWASFSSFRRAFEKHPEIRAAQHACGPGHTYKQLTEFLNRQDVQVFLSHQDWLKSVKESPC